ncbi:helix-turn-helix domain-containing protein [Metallosphaera hakonensis]|uniref:XRE family transcriptional regulator n=1 Tax=Metallosphaera hakonensis JCM 8857 = DSM 7519 TaxID=1293036 RepID=A0A2U9IRR5_9CREN|nr:helix-turn-helix domain-containing protein [Metallosphaera hakonensis]AWR98694.1 XRE family transcriptional regulator [Metallosphaera hakonensis JCM 8857 = DSM 7519]
MKKLYKVKFSLIHQGCWTNKIRDEKVVTLKLTQYNRRKVNVVVASPTQIVQDLKRADNVDEVLKFRKLKGGYIVEFVEDLNTTVSGAILGLGNNVLDYKNIVRDGVESWEIVTFSKTIVNNLMERFGVKNVVFNEVKLPNLIDSGLTEKEIYMLKVAMSMGYFNYPRSIKAKDVADSLGVSKQDFLYHLRNSISKIVSAYDLD